MAEPLNDVDLADLEALCKRASTAPWQVAHYAVDPGSRTVAFNFAGTGDPLADAALVRIAVEALPALVAEVRRLRARVTELTWETTNDPAERQRIEREWDHGARKEPEHG